MRREQIYIGGEWVQPHGEGEIEVINPSTEEIIGSVPVGNSDDINHAVSAARGAFESWSTSPIEDRIKILNDLSAALKELTEELRNAIQERQTITLELQQHADSPDPALIARRDLLVAQIRRTRSDLRKLIYLLSMP